MEIKYTLNFGDFFDPNFNRERCENVGKKYDIKKLKDVLGKEMDKIVNDNKIDIDEYKNIMYELGVNYLKLNTRKIKYSDDITFYLSIEIII